MLHLLHDKTAASEASGSRRGPSRYTMEDVRLSNPVTLDALPRQPRHPLACFERAISENNHFTNVYNRF